MSEPLAGGRYVRDSETEEFVRATEEAQAAAAQTTNEATLDEKTDDAPPASDGKKVK